MTRPEQSRRASYEPVAPQELFIVPLLKNAVLDQLSLLSHNRQPGARALDIGCGEQPFAEAIRGAGYEYCSLDVAQNEAGSVDYVCSIEEPLPAALRGEQFELITCLEVLEHVYSWDRAFANLAELLAPGGQALVTCPHVYPLHEEPYDFWRPTPYAFQRAAEAADLSCTRIIKAGDLWDVIGTILGGAQARPVDRSLRSRLTTRAVRRGCDQLVTALARGSLRRRTSLTGNTYLSAVVVLQKAS